MRYPDPIHAESRMPILAYGLNHRTAGVDLRGKVAYPVEELERTLCQLRRAIPELSEAAILSTCNRTEFHCALSSDKLGALESWVANDRQVFRSELAESTYAYWDSDAVRHFMRIASGLDSQVVGETQVHGQFRRAYECARHHGSIGPELDLAASLAIQTAKRVRSETEISKNAISIASATVTMALQIFTDLATSDALLIGAGDNTRLVAEHLKSKHINSLTISSRNSKHAQDLADDFGAHTLDLTSVDAHLHQFDLIVSSTASQQPIINQVALGAATRKRRHRPIFVADLAVPRDIEASAAELADVYLYTVDDLAGIVADNVKSRETAAREAEALIDEDVARYARTRRGREASTVLTSFRNHVDGIRATSVERAQRRLRAGDEPEEVVKHLARELMNQYAHRPTVALRRAKEDGDESLIELIRAVFRIGK